MSNLKPKYWTGSFVSMAIGVCLLALSHKALDEHTRFIAFSQEHLLRQDFHELFVT